MGHQGIRPRSRSSKTTRAHEDLLDRNGKVRRGSTFPRWLPTTDREQCSRPPTRPVVTLLLSRPTGDSATCKIFQIIAGESTLSFFALFLIYVLEFPKEPAKDSHETQDDKNNKENVHELISPSFLIKSSHVRYSLTITIPKSIAITIPKIETNTPSAVN